MSEVKMLSEKQRAFRLRQQILACRDDGRYNMFDVYAIQRMANDKGFYDLVVFLEENRKAYSNFIFTGDLPNLTDEEAKKMVRTLCYGREEIWEDRKEAEQFFLSGVNACEGSERERYTRIYLQIAEGRETCTDEEYYMEDEDDD